MANGFIREIIEVGSEDISWENWNGYLLHTFGEEPLPYLPEDQWQEVARTVAGIATFSNYATPDPYEFEDWREWVNLFIEAVNGPTRQGGKTSVIVYIDIE